jgi:hypothetical protein
MGNLETLKDIRDVRMVSIGLRRGVDHRLEQQGVSAHKGGKRVSK